MKKLIALAFVALFSISAMAQQVDLRKKINVSEAEVLILGITFKENCPDVRNTRIVDVVAALENYGVKVSIYDPWANPEEVKREYNIQMTDQLPKSRYDGVVLGVAHEEFLSLNLANLKKERAIVYDVKGVLSAEDCDGKL